MANDDSDKTFVTIKKAAVQIGVPVVWLEREAREGRIPVLRVGARRLCRVEAVRIVLDERSREGGTGVDDHNRGRLNTCDSRRDPTDGS